MQVATATPLSKVSSTELTATVQMDQLTMYSVVFGGSGDNRDIFLEFNGGETRNFGSIAMLIMIVQLEHFSGFYWISPWFSSDTRRLIMELLDPNLITICCHNGERNDDKYLEDDIYCKKKNA